MIEPDKKCYVIYKDPDPAASYEGWAIVNDIFPNSKPPYYSVTILIPVEEEGVCFPADCVFAEKPKAKITTTRPIHMEDVRHLAVLCVDLAIKETGMPDDDSHDSLYEDICAAFEKHFDYPHYRKEH